MILVKSGFLKSKIHKACGNDDLRPSMQCVFFHEGKAVATNAHILVVQDLVHCHEFTLDMVAIVEGKMLHKSKLIALEKCDTIWFTPTHIEGTIKRSRAKIVCEWDDEGSFPAYQKVIPSRDPEAVQKITMRPSMISMLYDAFCRQAPDEFEFTFRGSNTGVIVTNSGQDMSVQFGMTMPVFKYLDDVRSK